MKRPLRLGLLIEGKLTGSAILHSPAVLSQLGPVRAKTLRVARRATNSLGAGIPTERYDAFENTQLILIHVPPESAGEEIHRLAAAELTHTAKAFALCESWCSSDILAPLIGRGASGATTLSMPTAVGRWIVLEGGVSAVRNLRGLLDSGPDRVIVLKEGQKQLLFAAELLAGVLPLALFSQAEEALRSGDISGRHLHSLLDGIGQRMLLDAGQMSHTAVRSPMRDCPGAVARSHMRKLNAYQPELAAFLQRHLLASPLSQLLPQSAKLEEDE